MEYRLLSNPGEIRRLFMERYVESYEEFRERHKEWIARLHTAFHKEYYDKMFMWDRLIPGSCAIRFADALARLKNNTGEVLFLTESTQCGTRQFCRLNNRDEFAAAADGKDLAQCISYEWYTECELFEQGRCLADPILPSDLYVFDGSLSWCLIFTHETDETESADSRFCLFVDGKAANSEMDDQISTIFL